MTRTQKARLGPLLEAFYNIPCRHRIENDPIVIPRRYTDPLDIETVGWLTVSFAYGRAPLFNQTVEKVLSLTHGPAQESFYRYLLHFDLEKERHRFREIYYRFSRSDDILAFVYIMSRIVQKYGGIKPLFLAGYHDDDPDIGDALGQFVKKVKGIDTRPVYGHAKKPYGLLYFFPSPENGGACKRLHLYLRWMIRPNNGIDFGLWNEIPPAKLIIPLDTHIARIGRYLGLTARKTTDLKMAREITQSLAQFDPVDPLKYDFPLCHLGISQNCPTSPNVVKCRVCPLQPACKTGKRLVKTWV
jgi:uncharacterized protein (TIGR02757 family)